jgi:hypothetical protein
MRQIRQIHTIPIKYFKYLKCLGELYQNLWMAKMMGAANSKDGTQSNVSPGSEQCLGPHTFHGARILQLQDITRCCKMLQDVLFRKSKGNQRSKTNLCSLMFAICNDLMIPGPRIFLLELLGPVLWRERNSVKDQYNSDQHDHPSCIVFGHTLSLKKVIKGMESCLNGMQAHAG